MISGYLDNTKHILLASKPLPFFDPYKKCILYISALVNADTVKKFELYTDWKKNCNEIRMMGWILGLKQ